MVESVSDEGDICVHLLDGFVLRGRLHPSLSVTQARSLAIRILDLKSAYKQQPTSRETDWAAVLLIWNPDEAKYQYYVPNVLLLGATAAVDGFARTADTLRKLGIRLFALTWIDFFDGCTQLDVVAFNDFAKLVAENCLSLIGWKFTTKPVKRKPFSRKADVLGAVVDLSESEKISSR